jgi:hypothetical protein
VLQRILLLLKRNLRNFLLSRSFSDPPPSLAKRCKTLCLNHAGVKFKIISSYSDFEGPCTPILTRSKFEFTAQRKWSAGFLSFGHGKPEAAKCCNQKKKI